MNFTWRRLSAAYRSALPWHPASAVPPAMPGAPVSPPRAAGLALVSAGLVLPLLVAVGVLVRLALGPMAGLVLTAAQQVAADVVESYLVDRFLGAPDPVLAFMSRIPSLVAPGDVPAPVPDDFVGHGHPIEMRFPPLA